jgi:hypothetical protein
MYPGNVESRFFGSGVLLQDHMVLLPRSSRLVGDMLVKLFAFLISILGGECVIGFVTHFLTSDMDLRLVGNQRSGSGGE